MKKIILIFLALTLSLSLPARRLVIIHTNDTHSHIDPLRGGDDEGRGGVIERAAFIDSVRNADGKRNVLFLDAGDFSQGTSYFPMMKGDIEVDIINALEYDVVTLGNHEFDNGLEEIARRVKDIKCPVVCANYDFSAVELGRYVKPYTIVRKAGLKIGIIGLQTTDVAEVCEASIAAQLKLLDTEAEVNRHAAFLKEKKHCDLVICLSHLGYDVDGCSDLYLGEHSRNVDIIVGGHTHTFLTDKVVVKNLDGKDVTIVTDGCWGLNVGQLDVEF